MNFKQYHGLILEGGAYGHMMNVYEDYSLTFQDMYNLIEKWFTGGITEAKEKTDGQALAVSYRAGNVIFARNKGHYVGFGKNALKGARGLVDFFGDHPNENVAAAFVKAGKDLETAMKALSPAQLDKLFGDGSRWVNIEIIWPGTTNVIPYYEGDGVSKRRLIVLHNYREYDESGNTVGGDFDEYGRMMAGMLKQRGVNYQTDFEIMSMPMFKIADLKGDDGTRIVDNFGENKLEYHGRLQTIKNQYGLTEQSTVGDSWIAHMYQVLNQAKQQNNFAIADSTLGKVAYRWAYKKLPAAKRPPQYASQAITRIGDLKNEVGTNGRDFLNWVSAFEKDKQRFDAEFNNMLTPLRSLFLDMGVEICSHMVSLLTLHPSIAAQEIRIGLQDAIKSVKDSGDELNWSKVDAEIQKIKQAGGFEKIIPSEGLTFTFTPEDGEQRIYKFTGVFAPANQILGIGKYSR